MHEFGELVEHIWQNIMSAKETIMEALENKSSNSDLAAAYYRIAGNRLTDVDTLVKQAESCLNRAEAEKSEDFDDMDVLWAADHKRIINQIAHVKIYMEMYR